MRWTKTVAAMAMTIGAVAVSATAAPPAALSAPVNGAAASFAGHTISLGDNWSGAQTCVVYSRSVVTCYATAAEADKALGYSRATDPLVKQAEAQGITIAALPACASGWTCLWEAINGGGRRLIFRDDYWQDLGAYAFNNVLSSWRNNQTSSDWAWIADEEPGGPDTPLSLSGGGSYSSNVGTLWNDTADAVQG